MGADYAQAAGIIGAAVADIGFAGHIVKVQPAAILGLHNALGTQDSAVIFLLRQLGQRGTQTVLGEALGGFYADVLKDFIRVMAMMMVMMLMIVAQPQWPCSWS